MKMGFIEKVKTKIKSFEYGKNVDKGLTKSLGYGIKGTKDTPAGASGINVRVALKKTDSPFRKDDYKNPFMKEE